MNNTGIAFVGLYGFTLFICFVTYRRVRRSGPRAETSRRPRKLALIGFILSALTLTVYVASRLWDFGYTGEVIRVSCWDGMFSIYAVGETASQEHLKRFGWRTILGWFWNENTRARTFMWRLLPVIRGRSINVSIPVLWMFFTVLIPSCLAVSIRPPRTESNACSKCGYNLTGNESGICPECGTPIKDADPRP